MDGKPLRYSIHDWPQIVECKSNISPRLHLTYTVIDDDSLSGEVIRVEHEDLGCLFSYLVSGRGKLLAERPDGSYFTMDQDDVLAELAKYGFIIMFDRKYGITPAQERYIENLKKLGMDRMRFMFVRHCGWMDPYGHKTHSPGKCHLVAFKLADLPKWSSNVYTCTRFEFVKAIESGSAINITSMVNAYDWSFVDDKVLDLKDILEYTERIPNDG